MRLWIRKHVIWTSLILFVIVFGISAILSIQTSKSFTYYIEHARGTTVENLTLEFTDGKDSQSPLLRIGESEETGACLKVRMDAVESGSAELRMHYTLTDPSGDSSQCTLGMFITVSKSHVIFVGTGICDYTGFPIFYYGITVYAGLMMVYLIWLRRQSVRENRYSYRVTMEWAGLLFFAGVFAIYLLVSAVGSIWYARLNVKMMSLLTGNLMMAFSVMTIPFVLIFAIAMTCSNVVLMKHEGRRMVNGLGMLAGLSLLAGSIVILLLFILNNLTGREHASVSVTYSICSALYSMFLVLLGGALISGLTAGTHTPAYDKDYVIILGCAIRKDGTLYPLIRGRVDKAIEFCKAQVEKTGKQAILVPSGGQGPDEVMAEGTAMRNYLISKGIPEEQILPETNSTTTLENMKFSKQLIEERTPDASVAFSTTNYHVFRSGILAAQAGLHAEGMGSKTKWYFWPNALLREVAGLFAAQPKMQLLFILLLALLAGVSGYMYYLVV